ncbi:MAG: chemotaxis protein CheA [Deltaproteobacteria bacterium]|nr:chemotaxis protein CheA [Deltaproteobacteria bacterium]
MTNDTDFSILLDEFLEDAASHLDAVETSVMEMETGVQAGHPDTGLLTLVLGHFHTLKGNAGMMGFVSLQRYIHKLESLLKPFADGTVGINPALCESCLNAVCVLRNALRKVSDDPAIHPALDDELLSLDSLELHGTDSRPARTPRDGNLEDVSRTTRKSGTMKVDFEKLDEMLNLVGELVIHRTALASLETRLREKTSDREIIAEFSETSQLLGRTADNLREAVMKARMLPIGTVFHRFRRLVRDLSRRQGKEVELVFEGDETGLDKTIIDGIAEPLLHLIRNAVDHGIESPAERREAAKNPQATLKLKACHESNTIVITVEDDGRGIVAEKLRESAAAKGLLSERDSRALSDNDALQLLFLPGFSTSSEVTDTSGRGIGLDVVKKSIASFNGIIDVHSCLGAGTRFTIKLPLTLAIISALMVESAGSIFAVPLANVLESLRVDETDIHRVAAGEIFQLRDRLVPVFRLDRFFRLSDSSPVTERNLVIVGFGEKQGGLVVDRLVGQQEIVIKALDEYLGNPAGISGGTIMGDGSISLILDVAAFLGAKE